MISVLTSLKKPDRNAKYESQFVIHTYYILGASSVHPTTQ